MADELTMREKLIELLAEGTPSPYCNVNNMDCSRCEYNHPKWHCADIRIADHLIAKGVTIHKWIPVTERLPDVNKFVLVYGEGIVGEATRDGTDGKFYWAGSDEYCSAIDVTHWMPLPDPPKGE